MPSTLDSNRFRPQGRIDPMHGIPRTLIDIPASYTAGGSALSRPHWKNDPVKVAKHFCYLLNRNRRATTGIKRRFIMIGPHFDMHRISKEPEQAFLQYKSGVLILVGFNLNADDVAQIEAFGGSIVSDKPMKLAPVTVVPSGGDGENRPGVADNDKRGGRPATDAGATKSAKADKRDKRDWHLQYINAPRLRPTARQEALGAGTIVGVIDTGASLDHRELEGRIIGFARIDQNDDPVIRTTIPHEVRRFSSDSDPEAHGTRICSNICGATTGVAPQAKLLVVDVVGDPSKVKVISPYAVVEALSCIEVMYQDFVRRCERRGQEPPRLAAINISLQFLDNYGPIMAAVTKTADFKRDLVVAPVGNDPVAVSAPACHAGVLSVSAHSIDGHASSTCPRDADNPDLFAPGVGVNGAARRNYFFTGGCAPATGSSIASAVVSGAAAVLAASAKVKIASRDLFYRALSAGIIGRTDASGDVFLDLTRVADATDNDLLWKDV